MNLTDKLRMFAAEKKSPQPTIFVDDLDPILHGKTVSNGFGDYYLVENAYKLDHEHGGYALAQVLPHDLSGLAFISKDPDLQGLDLRQALFIDTETTGLAGGTGTYAFLVGVGYFTEQEFIVHQYLMRDYHEEAAMLYDLYQIFDSKDILVSFNGKRFDWPLLQARFTLNRFTPFTKSIQHIDLLYPARRIWKDKLDSCSLSSLETNILEIERLNDLPGSEVPQRFFDYVQTKQGELLTDILTHNVNDILSLVSLTSKLDEIGAKTPEQFTCPWECYSLARLYEQRKRLRKALSYYHRVLEIGTSHMCRYLSQSQIGLIYRRQRRWDLAEPIWLALYNDEQDIQACEELAKYYEHQLKDYSRARVFTERGLALARRYEPRKSELFEYRLARLRRKQDQACDRHRQTLSG